MRARGDPDRARAGMTPAPFPAALDQAGRELQVGLQVARDKDARRIGADGAQGLDVVRMDRAVGQRARVQQQVRLPPPGLRERVPDLLGRAVPAALGSM